LDEKVGIAAKPLAVPSSSPIWRNPKLEIRKEPFKQKDASVIDEFKRCATPENSGGDSNDLARTKRDPVLMVVIAQQAIRAQILQR